MEALKLYGKNWKKVQEYVGTRTTTQARSHAQKYFAKLENKELQQNENNEDSLEDSEEPNGNPKSKLTPTVKPLELTEQKIKRRLKGPYSPGKRHIKCGNCAEIKEMVPAKHVSMNTRKQETAKDTNFKNYPVVYSEVEDKSFKMYHNGNFDGSELDFDIEPETIQPLRLENRKDHSTPFNGQGKNYNKSRKDFLAGLI